MFGYICLFWTFSSTFFLITKLRYNSKWLLYQQRLRRNDCYLRYIYFLYFSLQIPLIGERLYFTYFVRRSLIWSIFPFVFFSLCSLTICFTLLLIIINSLIKDANILVKYLEQHITKLHQDQFLSKVAIKNFENVYSYVIVENIYFYVIVENVSYVIFENIYSYVVNLFL